MAGTIPGRGGRRRRSARALTGVTVAALLTPLVAAGPASPDETRPRTLQDAFRQAAQQYDVPQSVLLGVSYLQSRWDGHAGAASVSGGYGPMHLTDLRGALARSGEHHHGAEDPRGDAARPLDEAALGAVAEKASDRKRVVPARLRTLPEAARLTGIPAERLRGDPAANIAGGAALLADAQRTSGRPLSDEPADWYGAVAEYAGAEDRKTAEVFADDVFDVIREGAARTNDAGQRVRLPAHKGLEPKVSQLGTLELRAGGHNRNLECPAGIACEWIPAPYEQWTDEDGSTDYGNHDLGNRPESQDIDYIVVHDTEATYETTLDLVQDPEYVSWHY
ncbi:N-acetylmuramoyl-L-alanine amidase, partial [Streptomyces sp. TR06-5]